MTTSTTSPTTDPTSLCNACDANTATTPAGYCDTCDPHDLCIGCDENRATLDEICKPCHLRTELLLITQSAMQELIGLQRKLDEQEEFIFNATDFEILESSRRLKRLIEAHDCLEDAQDRAGYGLAIN